MLVFVAHDFREPPLSNYREVYATIEASSDVKFLFGDDPKSSRHLLSEIEEQIRNSDLCLFDLSTQNFNVALELGLARGFQRPHIILIKPMVRKQWFRPSLSNLHLPADIQGIRYIQYKDGPRRGRGLSRCDEGRKGALAAHG